MRYTGYLRKLNTKPATPIEYHLNLDDKLFIPLNPHIGKQIQITFTGHIHCIACGKSIKKAYQQGYCFPCTQQLARCDLCIVKPELCHYHQGTCREPSWGEAHCMKPHIVYLAYTSGVKVGITRYTNMPYRWHDQGAVCAMPIYQVSTRLNAGLVEATLSQWLNDKTNWRTMLSMPHTTDHEQSIIIEKLYEAKHLVQERLPSTQIKAYSQDYPDPKPLFFNFPMQLTPSKIASINIQKKPDFCATLVGIKGQYLIFDTGVINIRKYSGHQISITIPLDHQ